MSDSLPDLPVHHQLSEFTQTHVHCRFFTIWATREPSLAQRLKCLPAMRETWVQSLGQKRSPGEGNGYPFQYSCLENPMDGGAWWATVHGVPKSWTWPRDFTFFFHAHWVGDAIQPSHLLPSPSPPAFNLSQHQGLFKWVSSSHQEAKYWSFIFSISPFHEYSRLISLGIDWLDLLAVQGTLKSLLQHHSSKATIFRCSAFFVVLLSHPYMTTGKTIALTRQTFVGKVMSLVFNMLSRFVIAFLPRSKRLLISWLQSPSAVILEPKKIVCYCFHCFPIYFP